MVQCLKQKLLNVPQPQKDAFCVPYINVATTTIKTCPRSLCAYIHPWLNGPQSDGNYCHAL